MEEQEFQEKNTGIIVPKERSENMKNFKFDSQSRRQLYGLPNWMSWGHRDNQPKSETEGL